MDTFPIPTLASLEECSEEIPRESLYPLMMADKESQKNGMQRRKQTVTLDSDVINALLPSSLHPYPVTITLLFKSLVAKHLVGTIPIILHLSSLLHPLVEG